MSVFFCGLIGLSQNTTCSDGNVNITLNTGGTDFLTVNTINGYNVNLPNTSYGWANPLVTLFVTTSVNQPIYFHSRLYFPSGLNNNVMKINYNFYAQRLA